MGTINTFGNKQTPALADKLHLWSTGDGTDMNISLEQLRDLMIGVLGSLDTTDKASIVAAINELNGPVKYAASLPKQHNGLYDGRNLKNVFASAADFSAAVFAGDFSQIEDGDYWPITISGNFKDYASNSTKTLTNAVFKMEFMVNPYFRYGDSGKIADGVPHLLAVARDLIPILLQFRSANETWYDEAEQQPWTGSHLYQTLNNPSDGLVKLIQASELGPYIHTGPNGKGMRSLMETKAKTAASATGWGWKDRGILFLPTEKEVWGNATFSKGDGSAQGAALQWPLFVGNRRHISKGLGDGGSRSYWWCESSYEGSTAYITFVYDYGLPYNSGAANTAIGVPLCFLIAANA